MAHRRAVRVVAALGPARAVTLSSKRTPITCSPVPTASAKQALAQLLGEIFIAIATESGTVSAAAVFVW